MGDPSEWLREAWRLLRNDASRPNKTFVHGAIAMAEHLGALTAEQAELWTRRLDTCPGHDDEGGRDWCAYCGVMPRGCCGEHETGSGMHSPECENDPEASDG